MLFTLALFNSSGTLHSSQVEWKAIKDTFYYHSVSFITLLVTIQVKIAISRDYKELAVESNKRPASVSSLPLPLVYLASKSQKT